MVFDFPANQNFLLNRDIRLVKETLASLWVNIKELSERDGVPVYPLLQRCRRLLPLAVNSSSVPARVALPVVAAALEAATALEELPEEAAATARAALLVAAAASAEEAAARPAELPAVAVATVAEAVWEAHPEEAAATAPAELPAAVAAAASEEAQAVPASPVRSPLREGGPLQAVSRRLPK